MQTIFRLCCHVWPAANRGRCCWTPHSPTAKSCPGCGPAKPTCSRDARWLCCANVRLKSKLLPQRIIYCLCGLIIVIAGVASRVFHSGFALIDHDLGEALYAALAYVLLGIVWPQLMPVPKALITLA